MKVPVLEGAVSATLIRSDVTKGSDGDPRVCASFAFEALVQVAGGGTLPLEVVWITGEGWSVSTTYTFDLSGTDYFDGRFDELYALWNGGFGGGPDPEFEAFARAYEAMMEEAQACVDIATLFRLTNTPMFECDEDDRIIAETVYQYPDPAWKSASKLRKLLERELRRSDKMESVADAELVAIWEFNWAQYALWFSNGKVLLAQQKQVFGVPSGYDVVGVMGWHDVGSVYDMTSLKIQVERVEPALHVYISADGEKTWAAKH